jgi:hypothetical protein
MAAAFRTLACLFVAMLLFGGYHAREVAARVAAFQNHWEWLGKVDVENGIQADEAAVIAGEYQGVIDRGFLCGGVSTPILAGGAWKAEILFGFGGEPTGVWINVDPISGGVTTTGVRGYKTLGSLRRVVLLNALLDGR